MPNLSFLDIHINRPNPDDIGGFEKKIVDRLKKMRASSMREVFTGSPGQTLSPDEDAQALAKVALSNGRVDGKGRDQDGLPVMVSTTERPLVHPLRYDPTVQTEFDELFQFGQSFQGRTD